MRPQKLDEATRCEALASLAGWQEVAGRDAIAKTFRFREDRKSTRLNSSHT